MSNMWDLQSWKTLVGHKNNLLRIKILHDGKHLISSGADLTLKVWNIEQLKMMTSFTGDGEFLDIDLSVNDVLAVGDRLGYLNLINFENLDIEEPLITPFENSVKCVYCQHRFVVNSNDLGEVVSCPECGNKLHINKFKRESLDLSKTMVRHRQKRVPRKKDYKKKEQDLFSNVPEHLRPKELTSEDIDKMIKDNKKKKMDELQQRMAKKNKKLPNKFSKKTTRPHMPRNPTKKSISNGLSSKEIQKGFDNLSKIENFMKDVSKKNKTSKPNNLFGMNKPKPPSNSIISSMNKSKGKPKKKTRPKKKSGKKPDDKKDTEDKKTEE